MTCFINHSCRLSLSIISLLATTSPRQCYPVINLWHVGLRSLPKFRPDSGQDFFQVFGEAKGTLLGGIEWAADLTAGVPPECSFFCEAPSSRVGKLGGVCLRFCCANVQPAAGIFARTSLEHGSDSTTSGDLDARLQLLPAFLDCVRACACVCVALSLRRTLSQGMAFNHGEIQLEPYKQRSQRSQPGNMCTAQSRGDARTESW